ncbi:hypothetical protein J2848_006658 [Azospirillum lipoferum]|uniref:Uncharacterized protein n=1 Tax=Azospirillum lipoferum TaxID=193 RepID=A0A5A9G701_AZOLI|nr:MULTISPECIES: hypothetical protein [Azospirillum]KAA0590298.1 hypothetical protein FZ942_31950 [Azospirillum lipoferum]MCP1614945.1 hypothetical protein [Azospirillum lipoferum]MDW5532509.1 hypothetical protein [Azospirillum sp. NL1]
MPSTPDPANGQTADRQSDDRQFGDRRSGQAQVPKPPSRAEVEEISRSQEYLTDDWTGDGGNPQGDKQNLRQGG